ncbi:MAG: guanosine monophosphate reductase [Ignavibacteriales bacterium]|nr:guanosine monophosphate reductase [Ignavibacteriales bacterium]
MHKTYLTFDDISIIPRVKSTINSRSEVDLRVMTNAQAFLEAPIVASPMDTVCNGSMAAKMNQFGLVGLIHRFQSISNQVAELKSAIDLIIESPLNEREHINLGIATGVSGDYQERLFELHKIMQHYRKSERIAPFSFWVCFDTANGFSSLMEEAVIWYNSHYSGYITVAGNVASKEGYLFLAELGINVVRVGIGGGSACSTSIATGIGGGLISILEEIKAVKHPGCLVMADGGIRYSGDVVKSLALGADLCMLGRLLAGFDESPGAVIKAIDGKKYKLFRGLASKSASEILGQQKKAVEGIETLVEYKGTIDDFVQEFLYGIRSGLSYCDCRSVAEFRNYIDSKDDIVVVNSQNAFIERIPKLV